MVRRRKMFALSVKQNWKKTMTVISIVPTVAGV